MKLKKIISLILIIAISIISYYYSSPEIITSPAATIEEIEIKTTPYEDTNNMNIYFCQVDNCSSNLEKFLNESKEYIHCGLYDIDLENIKNILVKKSKNIDVKVVIDNANFKDLNYSFVKEDNNNQLMHNKFCIIDDKYVWTGSFNPTQRGAFKNDNNVIKIESQILAKNYEDEFKELWQGNYGKGNKVKNPELNYSNTIIENYFCPEDGCEYETIKEIKNAKESIKFMTFSFTSQPIAEELYLKSLENIKVKGIMEKSQNSKYSVYKYLTEKSLNVSWDKNKYNMHHKVFIIDNKTVITGSYNPTKNGNTNNDENILIIHNKDIANKYLEEYERISSIE